MAGGIDGLALGAVAAGGLFLYAAIKGKTITGSLQSLIKGQSPSSSPSANQIPLAADIANAASTAAGSVTLGGAIPTTGSGQQAIQQAATARGWGPGTPDWQPLQNLEMREAGFNSRARNPSGAFGLAQALGHGAANTAAPDGTNEYGPLNGNWLGMTPADMVAANSGQPGPQAIWMMGYIAVTYTNPRGAWAHEQSHNWY